MAEEGERKNSECTGKADTDGSRLFWDPRWSLLCHHGGVRGIEQWDLRLKLGIFHVSSDYL